MPLSYAIPLGILIALGGAVLFFATKHKQVAVGVMAIGAALAILTFILIVIASATM